MGSRSLAAASDLLVPIQDPEYNQNIIPGRPPAPKAPAPGAAPPQPAPTAPRPAAPAAPKAPAGLASGNRPVGGYTTLTGDPAKGAVPPGEYNVIESLMGEWESLVGYSVEPTTAQLLAMANQGVQTLADFGKYMSGQANAKTATSMMPWANYGLTKDEYVSASMIFGTTYKQITGSDISPDALAQAFQNPRDPTGGLLTGSEYRQQLMNDATLQKTFGWVKYGLDFSAWTQQKLQLRGAFGRDINDTEAATILQYQKSAQGPNVAAVGRGAQQQQAPAAAGVGGSVVR